MLWAVFELKKVEVREVLRKVMLQNLERIRHLSGLGFELNSNGSRYVPVEGFFLEYDFINEPSGYIKARNCLII